VKLEDVIRELEVSLQALKEENAMLRDQRAFDNDEAARLYDFARDKGAALERAAVVAWLRACEDESCVFADDIASQFAAEIERGKHRRGEGA